MPAAPSLSPIHVGPHERALAAVVTALACCAVLLLTGCNMDEDERCEELESLLDSKAAALPRDCTRTDECVITQVCPGQFIAARVVPADPERDAAFDSLSADCASAPDYRNVFEATCDSINDQGVGRCELLYDGAVVTDEAAATAILANHCACESDAECGEGLYCVGCMCLSQCDAGCLNASSCDGWTELGIGTDLTSCVEVCEHNQRDSEAAQAALCLAHADDCSAISACL